MSDDQRLESMIRSCLDHEVREVMLPAGFAERITRRRRSRRSQASVGLAALATVAAAVLVPVSFLSSSGDPVSEPVLVTAESRPEPRALEGRVRVTGLPAGARFLKRQTRERLSHVPARAGRAVWARVYRLRSEQTRTVWVWVFSGDITVQNVLTDYRVVGSDAELRWMRVSRGRAMVGAPRGNPDRQSAVLELEPGLVVAVTTMGVGRARTLRIAEGVRVG